MRTRRPRTRERGRCRLGHQLLAVTLDVKHELEILRFVEPSLVVVLLAGWPLRIQNQEAGEKGTDGEEGLDGEEGRDGGAEDLMATLRVVTGALLATLRERDEKHYWAAS